MDMARSHEAALDEAIAALRLDRSGQIVDATIEAASMLGFGAGELHGLTLSDLAAEQWREMAGDATARILLGDTRIVPIDATWQEWSPDTRADGLQARRAG